MNMEDLDAMMRDMDRVVCDPFDLRLEDLDVVDDDDDDPLAGLPTAEPLEPLEPTSSRIRAYSSCDFDSLIFSESLGELDAFLPEEPEPTPEPTPAPAPAPTPAPTPAPASTSASASAASAGAPPDDFDFTQVGPGTIWGAWTGASAGGCFNFASFAINPQFPLTVRGPASGDGVSVTITLTQLATVHAIGVSVVNGKGAVLAFKPSEDEVVGSSTKYVRETSVSCTCTLAPQPEPYMVLATTYSPGQKGEFHLSVGPATGADASEEWLASSGVKLHVPGAASALLAEMYPHVCAQSSEWRGRSAGGCVNYASVKENPQFLLSVTEPTKVMMSLVQRGFEGEPSEHPIAMYVCEKHGKKLQTLLSADVVVSSGQYAAQQEVRMVAELQPSVTPYTCMATAFEAGSEAAFEWRIWSSAPVVFEPYQRVAPTASVYGMKYMASMASEWVGPSAGGSVNEPTVGANPQFYLYVPSAATSVVFELEQAGCAWPIAVYCVDRRGMLAKNLAKAEIVASSGKYICDTAVVARAVLDPLVGAGGGDEEMSGADDPALLPYTVLPTTFVPGQEGAFTVQVYSDKPVRLEPANPDALFARRGLVYKASLESEWVGDAAGGCANFATAGSNPQFQLVVLPDGVSARARAVVVLEQEYHDEDGKKELHIIGAYVCDNEGERIEYLYEESVVASTARYTHNSIVETSEAVCRTNRPYTVFGSTFHPGKEARFKVSVYSDMEVSLTRLERDVDPLAELEPLVELHSIWKDESAGGAINFGSCANNPQFSLFVPPSAATPAGTPVNVRLTLVRQAPGLEVPVPIGFIVADISGARVSSDLGTRALVGESGPFVNVSHVSVLCSLLPSPVPYTVMPSTFEPETRAVFTLQVRSNYDGVRLCKWRPEHDVQALALQALSHVVTASGEWRGLTAGGCINFPTSALNPMYGLTVSGSAAASVHVCLRQIVELGKEMVPIGILVADLGGSDPRTTPIRPDQAIGTSGDFLAAAEVVATVTLTPDPHPYVLFCSTFAPNQEAAFEIVVTSDVPVELTKLAAGDEAPAAEAGDAPAVPERASKPALERPAHGAPPTGNRARLPPPPIGRGGPPRSKTVAVRINPHSQELHNEPAQAALAEARDADVVAAAAASKALATADVRKTSSEAEVAAAEAAAMSVLVAGAKERRAASGDGASARQVLETELAVLDDLIDAADDLSHGNIVESVKVERASASSSGGGPTLNARERKESLREERMSIVPRSIARSSTLHADLRRMQSSSPPPNNDGVRRGSVPTLAAPAASEPLGAADPAAFPLTPVPVAVIKQLLTFLFSLFDPATPAVIVGAVLVQPDGMLVRAMAKTLTIKQAEMIAMPLVHVFGSQLRLMTLVQTLIAFEIGRTHEDAGSTLFRSNTLTTKVMSAYCTVMGSSFLRKVIVPVVDVIEADPAKLKIEKYGDNPAENIAQLLRVLNMLVDAIFESPANMPAEIRTICHALARRARSKFPQNVNHVLAGLVFLRFICPALVTPSKYGLRDEPLSRPVRNGLVMVSKTIQRLANGVKFPGSEPYMLELNTFIEARSAQLNTYLLALADVDVEVRTIRTGVAVAHFEAVEVDELSFVQGQSIVDLVTTDSPEWLCGCVNGKTGLFPAQFAHIIHEHIPKYAVEPICELSTSQRNALIDVIRGVLNESKEAIVSCLSSDYRAKDDDVELFRMEMDVKVKSTFRQRLLAKFRRA